MFIKLCFWTFEPPVYVLCPYEMIHELLKFVFPLQADKEKKVKKKKAKEEAPAEEAPAPAAAAPTSEKRASSRGSQRQVKRSGSNVFSMFSQSQVAEFKEVIISR